MAVKSTTLKQTLEDRKMGIDSKKKPSKLRSIKFPRLSFIKTSSKNSRKSRFSCLSIDPASDNSSPEQLSPVKMPDLSPNYMKVTTSYDAKKGSSQRGIGSVSVISNNSSTSRSLATELSAQKKDSKLKNRPVMKKIMKNFGSTRSFRRRSRSTIKNPTSKSQSDYASSPQKPSSVEVSESSSPPHYRETTSRSEGKTYSQESLLSSESTSFDSSDQSRSPRKYLQTLSRTSSMRSVKILINKASFKSKRDSSKCCQIPDKATCSSTLKDSKFQEHVEVPSGQTESDRISKFKVCSYHHCSLHGRRYDDPSPLVKCIYRRRRLMTSQKSIRAKSESRNEEKFSVAENTTLERTQLSHTLDPLVCEEGSTTEDAGFFKANEATEDADLVEIAFGETSFPEQSYQETLNIMSKYADFQSTPFTASKCYNWMAGKLNESTSVSDDVNSKGDSSKTPAPSNQQDRNMSHLAMPDDSVDTSKVDESNNRGLSKNGPFTIRTRSLLDDFDEAKDSKAISSASASNTQLELGEMQETDGKAHLLKDLDSRSCPVGDSASKDFPPLEHAEPNASSQELYKQVLRKKKHRSMWNLIRGHMISDASAESENKLVGGADDENDQDGANKSPLAESSNFSEMSANEDPDNQEIELRKLFTIKLVREAIEKILLPEVLDQLSDDQSVTNDVGADQESLETSLTEASTNGNFKELNRNNEEADAASKTKTLNTEDIGGSEKQTTQKEVKNKYEKRAPKHWSNLKKWILLQRFVKELEKVRKVNPSKPRHLQLNPDPEAEKVNLRPRTADERKRGEEWMLDYALQQAVSQLAPTQQRKVELLIKAFETVVPPQGDNSQAASSKLRANSEEHLQIKSEENELVAGAGNMVYEKERVIVGTDRKFEGNDLSMHKHDDTQQSILRQKLDEVTSASNDELLVKGKAQKEDQEDECSKLAPELQNDISRASHEKEEQDNSNDSRKETEMNVSLVSECEATEKITISSNEKVEEPVNMDHQGSHNGIAIDSHTATPSGRSVATNSNLELGNYDGVRSETPDTAQSSIADGNKNSFGAVIIQTSTSACDVVTQERAATVQTAKESEKEPRVVRGFSLLLSKCDPKGDDGVSKRQADKRSFISMWHMISQHVLSDVASKVGNEILEGTDDEVEENNTPAEMKTCNPLLDSCDTKDDADTSREDHNPSHHGRSFCRDDAVKLIREAVNEILTTPIQDDSSDTQSVTSDIIPDQEFLETGGGEKNSSNSTESLTNLDMSESGKMFDQEAKDRDANAVTTEEERAVPLAKNKPGPPKSKNWSKLKKLILLKRSIKALERARKFNPRAPQILPPTPDQESEKVDLRHQMTDERKKAEQWMLDYAMQHIVTKLTPARKRRVAMLVEAFEAVVPLPEV